MEIVGQKREQTGKKVKALRREGSIPASMYGYSIESTPIALNLHEFEELFAAVGETALVDLKIDNDTHKILIKEVQHDPISNKITHASLYKPNLTEKTEVQVPVDIIGEEKNALVKGGEALVLVLINEITVSALPSDLPDAFTVDISMLTEVGEGITVGQLNYDREKVEIPDLEEDELVVKLDYAEMEQEEEGETELTEEEAIAKMEATEETAKEDDEGGEGSGDSSPEEN